MNPTGLRRALAGSLLLAACGAASASPLFGVFAGSGNNSGCAAGTAVSDSPVPLSREIACVTAIGTGQANAAAGQGTVGASARVATVTGETIPFSIGANASFADTIVFTKTNPGAPDQFTTSLNLILDGAINAAAIDNASAGLDLTIGFLSSHSLSVRVSGNGASSVTNSGNFGGTGQITTGGPGFSALLATPAQTASVGSYSLSMLISASAGSRGINGSALADFGHTLSFPTDRDVFDLPDGYTVNAGDYLVNNRFVTAAALPVDSPATLALFGLGLAGLAALRHAARRSRPRSRAWPRDASRRSCGPIAHRGAR